jgi:hypothetical protein
MCTDAASGLIIGSPSISPGRWDGEQSLNAEDIIRMIGGTYRLASIAVEIGTKELVRQTRRISDELRVRRRLWRPRRRPARRSLDLAYVVTALRSRSSSCSGNGDTVSSLYWA